MKKAEYIRKKYIEAEYVKGAIAVTIDSGLATTSDDIAELIDELPGANVEPVRRWVSVKDALPEGKDSVLVVVSGKHKNITFDRALELAEYTPGEGWYLDAYPEREAPGVTHWMPLPELPMEREE